MMADLRHTGIVVQDLERSLAFWRDRLGFRVVDRRVESGPFIDDLLQMEDCVVEVVRLEGGRGGQQLELLQFHRPSLEMDGRRTLRTQGLTHVAVTVDDAIDFPLATVGRVNPEKTALVAFTVDPDGTLVELVRPLTLRTVTKEFHGVLVEETVPDYLAHTYDPVNVPFTGYPLQLATWLARHVIPQDASRVVDLGCGRGEYLEAFGALGYQVIGVDRSLEGRRYTKYSIAEGDVRDACDLPPHMDVAFSKSVLEHQRHPARHLRAMRKCLKPGGTAIVLTPSWEHTAWGPFYIDPTHVSPFTVPSLQTAMELAGFTNVRVRVFTQLPAVWRHPWLMPLVWATAALRLPYRPYHATAPWPEGVNRWIRFSRERMLLAVGTRKE